MSSEISIEAPSRVEATAPGGEGLASSRGEGPPREAVEGSRREDGFRPWHFFVLTSILLATVAVILARQSAPEHLILISFTIAAAGVAAGAFYRMLAPLTAPAVLRMSEPVSERARASLEREKSLVLRSIKELEFDRAMGKLSQRDFDEMAGRLRLRAMSLMKQLDLGDARYRDRIEQELKGRLRTRSLVSSPIPSTARCGVCAAANDLDAVFCKKCGTRLQPS